MPVLPSGQFVSISSERARYHATRQKIRITKESPHQDLYHLVDVVYLDKDYGFHRYQNNYRFAGYTVSDRQRLNKWHGEDRKYFLDWIKQRDAVVEIEAARKKIIYDNLPDEIMTFVYPQYLYSILQRCIARMSLARASVSQWRNTILNMRQCGVRKDELDWSGVLTFLDRAEKNGADSVSREELLEQVDFSNIRLVLTNELVRVEPNELVFNEAAEILLSHRYERAGLTMENDRYIVLRYVDPLFNYRIGYIKPQSVSEISQSHLSSGWLVFDPDGQVLLDQRQGSVMSYYPDAVSAKQAASEDARRRFGLKSVLKPSDKYEYLSLHGGDDYREWLLTMPDYQKSHFTSHFTERNMLFHIRTKTRYDLGGKKLLYIEELQSDWHQQHIHKGHIPRLSEKTPDAPFSKEWPLLAVKLMLIHAIEKDYDGIAWSPGHTQQMHFQSEVDWLLQLYDQIIPKCLKQLSNEWDGVIGQTSIKTKEPWVTPKRSGDYWYVADAVGHFKTGARLSKIEALQICERYCKSIDLSVPVFYLPAAMRGKIQQDGLPMFGSRTVDNVVEPPCGE
ncbi:MAG: hypothetical protein ACE5EH_00195 [Gammaproteobacteria bacterium]